MKFVNVTLKYAYTHFLPMVMMYRENDDLRGRKRIWGLVGSVLTNITHSLGIEYELLEPPDGIHGGPLGNGSYDGTMGLVKRHEVDLSSGPFPLTGDLFDNFLTFYPFMFIDIVIVGGFKKEYDSHPGLSLLEFDTEVRWTYLALIATLTVVSASMMFYYKKINVAEKHTCSPISDSLLELFAITWGKGSLAEFSNLTTRAMYLTWSLGTFFLICYFTSTICASSAVKTPTPRINDVATLVKHPEYVPYILKGCSLLKEFKECPLPHYRELYRMVKENKGERIPSKQFEIDQLKKVVNNEAVVITDIPCMESHAWRCQHFDGLLYFAEQRIAQMQFSWAAVRDMNPEIVNAINERVHWITEMPSPWMRSFDINPMINDCILRGRSKDEATFEVLALFDVSAAFYLLLCFLASAIAIFLGEIILHRFMRKFAEANVSSSFNCLN